MGIFLGASLFTFYFGQGFSYLSKNPRACANCHIMSEQFASWQKSSHKAVAGCIDCHLPSGTMAKWGAKILNGYNHSAAFTLQNFHEPIRIHARNRRLLQANCVRCHSSLVAGMMNRVPADGDERRCAVCHRQVGHAASS